MSAVLADKNETPSGSRDPIFPAGMDVVVFGLLIAGFALLYVPSYFELARSVWSTDEQGHGPIILAVSIWLFYSKRHELAALPTIPALWTGIPILGLGLIAYVLGRSQSFLMLEVGSQLLVLTALILMFLGQAECLQRHESDRRTNSEMYPDGGCS